MPKYVATIYFETDKDAKRAIETAAERLEQFDPSIKILDTHVEQDSDE